MPNLGGLRGRLLLQAAVTALYALAGRGSSSGWTVPTVIVAVGAVFVALAMRPEPTWRWVVTGYEGFAVAFGAVALMSAHYVPGTVIAGYTLCFLLQHGGAAFAGVPAWDGSALQLPAPAAFPVVPAAVEPVVQDAGPALPVYAAPAPVAMAVHVAPAPVQYAPPAPVQYAPPAAAEPAVELPLQAPAPRPVAITVLPGR